MNPKAKEHFPVFIRYCKKLFEIGEGLFEKSIPFETDDHFSFMALAFVNKQLVHMRSLILLAENMHFPDSKLIARSMIEGMAVILWAADRPDERGLRWRAYAIVSDYKLIIDKKMRGESIELKREKELEEKLREFGMDYLKGKNPSELDFTNDPFRSDWRFDDDGRKIQALTLFQKIDGESLYSVYQEMSDWIHWNPRGVGIYLNRDADGLQFNWENYDSIALSLACGFQALLQSLDVFNDRLKLGAEKKLKEISKNYINELALRG